MISDITRFLDYNITISTRINDVNMLQCIIEMIIYGLSIIVMLSWVDDMCDGC